MINGGVSLAKVKEIDNSYKFSFKYKDIIDLNYEKDLYILSISLALSDLTIITQKLHKIASENNNENGLFYFKVGLAFAREAFELLKVVLEDKDFVHKYLENCTKIFDNFNIVSDIINEKSEFKVFNASRINQNRHLVFHYLKKKEDLELMKNVLVEIENEYEEVYFRESEDISKYEYQFAEIFQFNMLFDFYKINENNKEDLNMRISELAIFTAKLMNILRLMFSEYLIKKRIKWEKVD